MTRAATATTRSGAASASDPTQRKRRALRRGLLAWYRRAKRDLPWRRTRDPWAIQVSETMLQQTRVETVIPYYERFLARYPRPQDLAEAELDEVLALWQGLGYYGRARNLKRAAEAIVADGGGVPDTAEGLRALPGVGRYTAGAIASIAYDLPEPIVDGNVARVLARVFAIEDDVRSRAGEKRLWAEAAALVRGAHPGDFNQALMELGATLCTPRVPRCLACPVAAHCLAHEQGRTAELPVRGAPREPLAVRGVAVWLERAGRVLAVRRPPEGLLGGLWELPGGELADGESPREGLARLLAERTGLEPRRACERGSVEHAFTHRRLELHVFSASASPGRVRRRFFDAHRWLSPAGVTRLAHGGPTAKALALLGGTAA